MDYIFGEFANRPDLPHARWNPDASDSVNPHTLLCGGSGAGKTTLLVSLVKYLTKMNKHVFIFDLKGDMVITNDDNERIGNYIEFTSWSSQYGINPFEFDTGVTPEELGQIIVNKNPTDEQIFKIKNSGPKVQVERVIEIIKKNFMPTMGAFQKNVLMYLLTDTYLMKGFVYDDYTTWQQEIPSLDDVLHLINEIRSAFTEGYTTTALDNKTKDFVAEIQARIAGLKKYHELEDTLANMTESERTKYEIANAEKINEIKEFGEKDAKNEMQSLLSEYIEWGIESFDSSNMIQNSADIEKSGVNIDKYASKKVFSTMETVEAYIRALVQSGVFHSNKPPVKPGLNIVNISGLDIAIQRFVVDVWLGKVFRSCKIRGTYSDRPNKTRGAKCDTFVIVDESKLIAGTSRDKNDPYSYLNRIATEARGFGLGVIVASQSAEHFPPEFLKNFNSQIILNTGIADFDAVRKSFGIDRSLLEYTQQGWGHALVKTGRSFSKIKLNYKG